MYARAALAYRDVDLESADKPRLIARLFDRDPSSVRVFTARVGGGFGGKQEILTEDVVALAARS